MSRSGVSGRGDGPRQRAVPTPPPARGSRPRTVVTALAVSAGLAVVALFALRPADAEVDQAALGHAEAACELTSKAEEAAQVDTGARYAAAVLLLDKAIVESARAAQGAVELSALDQAVQAVHTSAHRGSQAALREALDTALAACRDTVG